MSPDPLDNDEEPASALSAPGARDAWRSYPGHALDEIEAKLRASGPKANSPEIETFAAMLAKVAPGVDVVRVGRAVIAAAREAARDARYLPDLRKQARAELDGYLRHGPQAEGEGALGLPRIAQIAERAGVRPRLAWAPVEANWLHHDDPKRSHALAKARRDLHKALASQGNQPPPLRRLADGLVTAFREATGSAPTVSKRWENFIAASAALVGRPAQPSEVANVARTIASALKNKKKSHVNC